MNKIFQTLVVLSLILPAGAHADTMLLANGNSLEGVVLWETPEKLEFQFAHAGSITFGRDEVVSVIRSDAAGRDALLMAWAAGYEAFVAELRTQEQFNKDQRAKGLMHDGQEWVTKDEFAARTEREKVVAAAEQLAKKEEAPAKKEIVYIVSPIPDYSAPIAAPVIVSYPVTDNLGRVTGYVQPRRHARKDKENPKKTRDWRGQTAWERAQTAHWNYMSISR